MMTRSCIGALLALAITIGLPSAALAIMDDERPPADDPDYAAGVAAFEREDWQSVIEIMERVVAQKPWHDDAHTRMGFAYRKQGDYERALRAYDKALALNPHLAARWNTWARPIWRSAGRAMPRPCWRDWRPSAAESPPMATTGKRIAKTGRI
jgi:cytochrome c-type biogenesis protein CcmH/NrfG